MEVDITGADITMKVDVDRATQTYTLMDGKQTLCRGTLTADGKSVILPLAVLNQVAQMMTTERWGAFLG